MVGLIDHIRSTAHTIEVLISIHWLGEWCMLWALLAKTRITAKNLLLRQRLNVLPSRYHTVPSIGTSYVNYRQYIFFSGARQMHVRGCPQWDLAPKNGHPVPIFGTRMPVWRGNQQKSTSASNLAIWFYMSHLYFICVTVRPSFSATVIFCNGMLIQLVVKCPYKEGRL